MNINFSAASILILTEVYGEKIKVFKYYHGGTLVIYELIGILSILTYAYSLMKLWSLKLSTETIQNMRSPIILYFLEPLFVISAFYSIFAHWLKNTLVHISLCEWKMFAVSEFSRKLFHCSCKYSELNVLFFIYQRENHRGHHFNIHDYGY